VGERVTFYTSRLYADACRASAWDPKPQTPPSARFSRDGGAASTGEAIACYGYARGYPPDRRRMTPSSTRCAPSGCGQIWTDTAGELASRPERDKCLDYPRAGDELVITRHAANLTSANPAQRHFCVPATAVAPMAHSYHYPWTP